MPDVTPYEYYPVSRDQIRRAAARIDAAIQPGSDDDPREWLTLPDRHRAVLENLNTLIEEARIEEAGMAATTQDNEVVTSTASDPVQASQE